jgi:hypothetical protein
MAQLKDQQTGTSGDNFTIGGNLSVTGTSTLTGNVTAPTQSSSDNSTKVATTAFVTTKVSTLGTMASQNASAVAITGGTITGITDLTVADGGTGASSITANSVILGNGTSTLSGNLVAPGTSGNVLKSNGTTWTSGSAITSGTAVTTTSGTTADFTGIPSTAKRITVMFSQVSTNGTSPIIVQLGSGSVQTTGYFGFCVNGITSGSVITSGINTSASQDANSLHSGNFACTLLNGSTWVVSGVMSDRNANGTYFSGDVTLSGALDRVRITTINGTDVFDSGSINILYE